jgi:hypothetical protein
MVTGSIPWNVLDIWIPEGGDLSPAKEVEGNLEGLNYEETQIN